RAHAGAGDAVDRYAQLLEDLQDADVRRAAGAAAGEREADAGSACADGRFGDRELLRGERECAGEKQRGYGEARSAPAAWALAGARRRRDRDRAQGTPARFARQPEGAFMLAASSRAEQGRGGPSPETGGARNAQGDLRCQYQQAL